MTKKEALKHKLKAADRRRQRRHVDSQPLTAMTKSATAAPVDVAGLIAHAILEHAAAIGSDARDVIVIAAIHSSLRGTTPSGNEAKHLAGQLNLIPSKPGVSMRAFRESLQQMLTVANANHDPRIGDAFLRYLSMLSES